MRRIIALMMVGGLLICPAAAFAAARLDPVLNELPVNDKLAYMQKFSPVMSKLGSGFNSFTNKMLGVGGCVNGTFIPPQAAGSSPTYQLDVITSYEQFTQSTSVEAQVSGSFGGFSASVKSEFDSSDSLKSSRTHLLVREFVKTMEISLDHRMMTIPAALTIKGSDKSAASLGSFLQTCGDQFVSTFEMGGEFIALLSSDASEEDLKSQLSISGSASYGAASASGDFKQSMDKLRGTTSLSVTMTRVGGSGDLPQISTAAGSATVDAILTYASAFPTTVEKFPVIYSLEAVPYGEGISFDAGDYVAAKTAYSKLQRNRNLLDASVIELNRTLKFYSDWAIPSAAARKAAQDRLATARSDLALINPILASCGNGFWLDHSCDAPARLLDENYVAPQAPKIIVTKLDAKLAGPVTINLPVWMKVVTRGKLCFSRDAAACLVNGEVDLSKSNVVYLTMQCASIYVPRYDGNAPRCPSGQLVVEIHDSDFSDNSGDLYVMAFEEP